MTERPVVPDTVRAHARSLALTVALLWVVHPLQTQSVTYLIQRAESLMGLGYLLTLSCLCRSADDPQPHRWWLGALASCAAGMASKPVMVTAPLAAFLYDRTFLAGSFRQAWRQRRPLYVGLAATWLWLAYLLHLSPPPYPPTAGFRVPGLSPMMYAMSQAGVILHYLRLILWPHPLVFDYDWRVSATPWAVWPPVLAIAGLLGLTIWAYRRRPAVGFLGAAFFLLLAPTSSVIPIKDLAAEHRLYLPLAPALALLVVGVRALLARLIGDDIARRRAGSLLLAVAVTGLTLATLARNQDYRSEEAMWRDTAAKQPTNARVRTSLGMVLTKAGTLDEAERVLREAIRLAPSAEAYNNLGNVYVGEQRYPQAFEQYAQALALRPDMAETHNNLANALVLSERLDEAIAQYHESLRLSPDDADVHSNLGVALARQGRRDEARAQYEEALRLVPNHAQARKNREALERSGSPSP